MTRSGRAGVIRTSGGMVSPLRDLPGKTLMMLSLFVRSLIHIPRWFRTQLCFHVYRPCSSMLLAHEGESGCFHIVYNWPTTSYSKVLNFEKWELMAKLKTRRWRV